MGTIHANRHTEASFEALESEVKKLKRDLYLTRKELIKAKLEEDNKKKFSRPTMDNMLEGCLIFDYDWRYRYLNDAAVKQCRRPKEELIGKVFMDVWPDIENTKVFSLMKDCLENRTPYSFMDEYEFSDRSKGWYNLKIQPVPEGVFVLSIEVTERKKAELEVERLQKEFLPNREKENLLSISTMDNMLEGCIIFGNDWRYRYLNDAAVAQCRKPKEELQEKVFTDVWPDIENTKVFSLMKDCLENRTSHSFVNEYEFPDKSKGWYNLKIQPVPEGVFVMSVEVTDQKRAEIDLHLSGKKLVEAQHIAKMGDFTLELETGKVACSGSLYDLIGYNKRGDVFDYETYKIDVLHPDDLDRVTKWINDSVASGSGKLPSIGHRLIRKDKKVIYVQTVGTIQKRSDNITLLTATVKDISEQKLAELEAEGLKNELLLAKVGKKESSLSLSTMDNMLEACIIFGPDWRYLYLNDAAVTQCRRPKGELIGKVFMDVWPGIEDTLVFKRMKDCLENRTPYSFVNEYEFPDKSIGWYDLRIQRVPEGVFTLSIDVTIRRKAEIKLQASKKRLVQAQYIAKMGDFTLEFETGKVSWSESLYNLLGYKPTDMINYERVMVEMVHPDDLDRVTKWLNNSITSGKGKLPTNEYRLIRKNKKVIFVRTVGIIQKQADNTTLVFATVLDITKQKLAEIEVKKLNRELEQRVIDRTRQLERMNNELKTFTYSVSHDLKAPLRGIDGYSKLLLEMYSADLIEDAQLFIRNIRESTIQMNQLIEDLLTYSRLERSELNLKNINIRSFITDILNLYQNEIKDKNISMNINISDSTLKTDQNSLSLALRNVIENAIKFTGKEKNPQITIGMTDNKSCHTIFVRDNGIGFNMIYHDKIFDIFQRLHHAEDYPGTGIGLGLVAKAMQRIGGRAYAESKLNAGATFYLEIPKISPS